MPFKIESFIVAEMCVSITMIILIQLICCTMCFPKLWYEEFVNDYVFQVTKRHSLVRQISTNAMVPDCASNTVNCVIRLETVQIGVTRACTAVSIV